MLQFGDKQVNRYLEKAKLAQEADFTSSLNTTGSTPAAGTTSAATTTTTNTNAAAQ